MIFFSNSQNHTHTQVAPDQHDESMGNVRVMYMITSQFITLGFFFAVCVAVANIPFDPVSARIQLLASLVMVDLLCIFVVHMFDVTPQIIAVINSRLAYTSLLSILNIITVFSYSSSIQVSCMPLFPKKNLVHFITV